MQETVSVLGLSTLSTSSRPHSSSSTRHGVTPLPFNANSASTSEEERGGCRTRVAVCCGRTCRAFPRTSLELHAADKESSDEHTDDERRDETKPLRDFEAESRIKPGLASPLPSWFWLLPQCSCRVWGS
jgi:hypothetical protein